MSYEDVVGCDVGLSCGPSGVVKAAAQVFHMYVAVSRSSSGANIWSIDDWSSEGLVSKWRSVWGDVRDQSSASFTLREKRGRHRLSDCCPS